MVADISPSDGSIVKRYIYVTDSHSPDYMIWWSKEYKLIKDHLGNIVMAINEADGTVFNEIEYDEFGNVLSQTKDWMHPFRFAGGVYEKRTGLTKFGVRDYDAETGRWTSKDPIRFDGGYLFYKFMTIIFLGSLLLPSLLEFKNRGFSWQSSLVATVLLLLIILTLISMYKEIERRNKWKALDRNLKTVLFTIPILFFIAAGFRLYFHYFQ